MATVNINGRPVERAALSREAVGMAREMAEHTRLLDNPLPSDTDLSQEEDKALQTQVRTIGLFHQFQGTTITSVLSCMLWLYYHAKCSTTSILRSQHTIYQHLRTRCGS